jgi:hypothetical protein
MRETFLQRDSAAMTRLQLDARGTDSERPSPYQKMANMYNDSNYHTESMVLEESWGPWYKTSKDCSWSELEKYDVLKISDGKEFKEKLRFMINELGSMHSDWNASGNGDDQQNCRSASDIDDSESTPESSISSLQGGDRLSFRVHRHPSVMYLWFSLLACGLWNAACTEFSEEWKGSGSNTMSVQNLGSGSRNSSTRKKWQSQEEMVRTLQEEDKKMRLELSDAIKENSYQMRVTNIQFEISNLEAKRTTLTNELVGERSREDKDLTEKNHIRVSWVQASDAESKKLFLDLQKEYEDKLAITRSKIASLELQLKAVDNDIESLRRTQQELTENPKDGTPTHSNILKRKSSPSRQTPSYHRSIQFHAGKDGKSTDGDDDGLWNTPADDCDNEGADEKDDDDKSLPPRVLNFK